MIRNLLMYIVIGAFAASFMNNDRIENPLFITYMSNENK